MGVVDLRYTTQHLISNVAKRHYWKICRLHFWNMTSMKEEQLFNEKKRVDLNQNRVLFQKGESFCPYLV